MTCVTYGRGNFAPRPQPIRRQIRFPWATCLAVALGAAVVVTVALRHDRHAAIDIEGAGATAPITAARVSRYNPLMDAGYSLGHAPRPFGQNLPLSAAWRPASPAPLSVASAPVAPAATEPAPAAPAVVADASAAAERTEVESAATPAPAERSQFALGTPLPAPRPPELFEAPPTERTRTAAAPIPRRSRVASAPQTAPVDNRNFLERLFGVPASGAAALAYAPADDGTERPRNRLSIPFPGTGATPPRGTAIYDISARTVYLPNGERLEAHSGLGDKMDDPRHAHVRMHGPTPPHTYDLTERERLFHGVRAIRLNPVGGSGAIYGRAGLLAHTYMLGPRGDSNGCISFKNYDRFLQAYLRGEVRRLVVVASL
jgi:Protein of unknown function (DUF2778)